MERIENNLKALACKLRKIGVPFSTISQLCQVSTIDVLTLIAKNTQLSDKDIQHISRLSNQGISLDQLSEEFRVPVDVLELFLPEQVASRGLEAMIPKADTSFPAQHAPASVVSPPLAQLTSMICAMSRKGHDFNQIADLLGVSGSFVAEVVPQTVPEISQATLQPFPLTPEPKDRGQGLPLNDRILKLNEVTPYFIRPQRYRRRESRSRRKPWPGKVMAQTPYFPPEFIYSRRTDSNLLYRTKLSTGDEWSLGLCAYRFKVGCCWSQLPMGLLYITGGELTYDVHTSEVVRIDSTRDYALTTTLPMATARSYHAAEYHADYLYVIGGYSEDRCERYSVMRSRWERLAPLARACYNMSAIARRQSLYVLGGMNDYDSLDTIQCFSLMSLTWQLLSIKLPSVGNRIACFKLEDSQVYLVIKERLYALRANGLRHIRPLMDTIRCYYGPSYYSKGTLFCSYNDGAARKFSIGSLN